MTDWSLATRRPGILCRSSTLVPSGGDERRGVLVNGHSPVGVWKDRLIDRIGPDEGEAALREPHVRRTTTSTSLRSGAKCLRVVARNHSVELSEENAKETLAPMRSLPPRGDVIPALGRLRDANFRLVTPTNSSKAALAPGNLMITA